MYKNKILSIAVLCALVSSWTAPVAAQNIYRCGDSYSQNPCPGGKLVPVDDARSAGQKAQTDLAVQRDAKAADAMEKARLKEEAKPAQASVPPPKAPEATHEESKIVTAGKVKKSANFTAVAPRKPGDPPPKKKKKKAKQEGA